ncbi:MAG TPA: glycosyltransferase family 4 protein [Stellaceae bacterium]|nr:glycosyltransferase family 4 protein [Stellaceae bacterium]
MPRPRRPAALLLDAGHPARDPADWEATPSDLRWLLRSGELFRHLLRHPSARILVDDTDGILPLKSALALRCLTSGPIWLEDRAGRRARLDIGTFLRLGRKWLRDRRLARGVIDCAEREIAALEAAIRRKPAMPALRRDAGALVLHTEFNRNAIAGGALAHLAGVVNELARALPRVDLVSASAVLPLLDSVGRYIVPFERRAWSQAELHQLNANRVFRDAAAPLAGTGSGQLVYQRSSPHNWTGAALALSGGLPFVLEFNGAEAWLARNWSRPLRFEALATRIEQANLDAADLVTVVSAPLRDHLLARGVPEERILVNPNGVDPERFTPERDGGTAVRQRLGLGDRCVVGFIGTFGPWHGAELLAEAFARLVEGRPRLAETTRLLLIGDGIRLPAVRALIERRGLGGAVSFAGLVAQAEAPDYLAACDILVAPTDANPDGSEFFGSPTKLFEYMAMGRAIVATRLGQVQEVLAHEETALLTPPGEPDALAAAIERLIDDRSLRTTFGATVRRRAVERHSWRQHVGRLLNRLDELTMSGDPAR